MMSLVQFMQRVEKTDTCWLWTGSKTLQGYGRYGSGGKYVAHRMSYILHKNIDPKELLVLHKCDNPPCVNPEHLTLGTISDNINDMWAKGRNVLSNAKLTIEQVREIRQSQNIPVEILSKKYNVCFGTIYGIWSGKRWKRYV